MPIHDDRKDISHGFCAERVNGDDIEMPQESRSNFIPSPTRGTHSRH